MPDSAPLALALMLLGLPMVILSIPMMLIWTYHKRKMEEIKLKREGSIASDIQKEFAAVRSEIQALRDTTMQYDLSFDTALQRMERRVEQIERQPRANATGEIQENPLIGGF